MTRADANLFKRLAVMMGAALGALYLVGAAVLSLNPPTDIDRKCLHKSLSEIGKCIYDHSNER